MYIFDKKNMSNNISISEITFRNNFDIQNCSIAKLLNSDLVGNPTGNQDNTSDISVQASPDNTSEISSQGNDVRLNIENNEYLKNKYLEKIGIIPESSSSLEELLEVRSMLL
jgi:hypothetical protein